MNDFLKSVIKEIGDDYASIAADGVEAGDVDSLLIRVLIFSIHYYLVQFMVDCQQIRLLPSLVKVQQVRRIFLWAL